MKLTITKKIGLLLLIPTLGAILALGVFYAYLAQTATDGHTLNVAGRQRMLSERLSAYTQMVRSGHDDHWPLLWKTVARFNQSLDILEHGGQAMDRSLFPAPPEVLDEIVEVKRVWAEHKAALLLIAENPTGDPQAQEAYDYVQSNILRLTEASDRVVAAFEARSRASRGQMLNTLALIAVFDLALLFAGIWVTKRYVTERRRTEDKIQRDYHIQRVMSRMLQLSLEPIPLAEQLEHALDLLFLVPWLGIQSKGCIFLTEEDSQTLVMQAQRGLAEPLLSTCAKLPLGKCLCGRAASTREIVFADCIDDRHENRFQDMRPHGHLCIPILDGSSKTLGVINIYVEEGHKREDGEEEFLTAVADMLAGIIERRRAAKRLQYLAHYDELTGLPNRTLSFDRLRQALARARWRQRLVSVLFLDLDRFKVINDTLGHDVGDVLLQAVGERLAGSVREGDTVGRLGGDEFVIILVDVAEENDVPKLAQKVLDAMAKPFVLKGREFFVTASMGISLHPNDGEDAEILVKNADTAIYRAKKQGGNNYQLYSSAMNARVHEFLNMETDLHRALLQEEFLLHYQPKVDFHTGKITGMEALVRWQRPELGLVSPAEFILLLEETGMIVPAGEWILRTACAQKKAWQEAGFPPMPVAVNLSARQFRQGNMAEMVAGVLKETGLEPRYLELELTESMLIEHEKESVSALNELNAMGVHLAIDDFGTGYSSLSYLKRFPIHSLKIDRSFIRDITADPYSAAIARATIAMAHSLRMTVVAEGVETKEQLAFLRKNHCDEMQGYYFSKPLPVDAFTQLLKESRCLDVAEFTKSTQERTLLVVDDEEEIRVLLVRVLGGEGYRVLTASSAREAFGLLACHDVGVILADHRMPEMTGVEFLSRVRELYPNAVRMVWSGYADLESLTDAINQGWVYKYMSKPLDADQLRASIQEAFAYFEQARETGRSTLEVKDADEIFSPLAPSVGGKRKRE